MSINDDARHAAGNWKREGTPDWPEGLLKPHTAEKWTVIELENSESNLLAQSNAEEIRNRLKALAGVEFHEAPRGYAGWVRFCTIPVFWENGSITKPFKRWYLIRDTLADVGVLNRKDYEERKRLTTLDNILEVGEVTVDKFVAPADWPRRVFNWLSENSPEELQVGSNEWGGYPREEAVQEAQRALGFFAEAV